MSTYEISKSSLLSLKAEILKKQEELLKAKTENDLKFKAIKKNTPLEFKNRGVDSRSRNDMSEEETDLLKLSRTKLEAKSKLYNKLSTGTFSNEELSKRYLVRFDSKKKPLFGDRPPSDDEPDEYPESDEDVSNEDIYKASDPSEDWVEYVDGLGRTRTCLKKDLEFLKANDEHLNKAERKQKLDNLETEATLDTHEKNVDDDAETIVSVESELISGDYKREMLRKQWEIEEEELRNKTDIHYQNVLFDEARTHGVGYYAFSKDEEERAKQQEALKKLRQETEQKQRRAQDLKAMREKQLAARVKAAKNRRRARLGLPPEEDEVSPPQPTVEKSPKPSGEDEGEKQKQNEEKHRELKRKEHIRPWDIGKEGVKEHYVYTQEEWVEKKRKERNKFFAPPPAYKKVHKNKSVDEPKEDRLLADCRKSSSDSRDVAREFSNYDFSDNILKGTFDTRGTKNLYFTTKKDNYSSNSANNCHKEVPQTSSFKPTLIMNECEEFDELSKCTDKHSLDSDAEHVKYSVMSERKRTEIPPPPTFEYCGPSEVKRSKKNVASDIEEAVEAGLRFLRRKVEKETRENSVEPPW